TTSLPVPDSPCRRTVASVGATRSAAKRTACQAGEEPIAVVRSPSDCLIASSHVPSDALEHARETQGNQTEVCAIPRCPGGASFMDPSRASRLMPPSLQLERDRGSGV